MGADANVESNPIIADVVTKDMSKSTDYLMTKIGDQLFGIAVMQIQDVLREQKVTRVPLAPPEVAGTMNLRGRVVTAFDVRRRLGLPGREKDQPYMSVVVELEHELYSLIIDEVGDVLTLKNDDFEAKPATLDPVWYEISSGIYRLEDDLLVILDVASLLNTVHK